MKKIIFMGTPTFAAKILEYLLENKINIIGVVSQPDRKVGRKQNIQISEVKKIAQEYNLPIFQPTKIKEDLSFFYELKPDLIITAAFGQIIPKKLLDLPPLGCINVHGSLLPKYRGGAPMQYALINGDTKTGVTIMEMAPKMDAGDMITQRSFTINFSDTLEDVHDKMIEVSKTLLLETLPSILNATYVATKQDDAKVVFSPTIKPDDEKIDWHCNALNIYNLIRALNPLPGAYSIINNKRFKFFKTEFINSGENTSSLGEILKIDKEGILINAKNGQLLVKEFQIEGKKKTTIENFINGNNFLKEGMQFND